MFDVAILGAGPAGSAAAISCAAKGMRVVVIEAAPFPRYRPGETLHPGVEPILAQLGVIDEVRAAGFLRHEGIYVAWNGPVTFVPYGKDGTVPWLGYQAWRADLDEILLRRVRNSGVCVMQPCVAKRPIIKDDRVTGLLTSEGEVHARFVLDGSGSASWLARRLGIACEARSRRLTAHYGYAGSPARAVSHLPKLRRNRNGWTWIARIQADRYHWTTLCIEPDSAQHAEVPRELRSAGSLGSIRMADVTWREVLLPAGPGYFLLGDAATILDPLSSHGVLKALMSGMWAAHLIGQTARGLSEHSAAAAYCQWIRQWFRHDSQSLGAYYRDAGLQVELASQSRSDHHEHFPAACN